MAIKRGTAEKIALYTDKILALLLHGTSAQWYNILHVEPSRLRKNTKCCRFISDPKEQNECNILHDIYAKTLHQGIYVHIVPSYFLPIPERVFL